MPNEEIAAIICANSWGGGRYMRWDSSGLWLVKENNDKLFIGKSEEGSFKFNDSLAVNNYILDEYAMSYENYPWKENVELLTSKNKMIINLEESSVEVIWDDTGRNLNYNLLSGENVIDKK